MHQPSAVTHRPRPQAQGDLIPTSPPVARPAATGVPAESIVLPSAVWQHLSPQQQALLCQTLLQTLQEVINHANGC